VQDSVAFDFASNPDDGKATGVILINNQSDRLLPDVSEKDLFVQQTYHQECE
jgi:hypothetical protein